MVFSKHREICPWPPCFIISSCWIWNSLSCLLPRSKSESGRSSSFSFSFSSSSMVFSSSRVFFWDEILSRWVFLELWLRLWITRFVWPGYRWENWRSELNRVVSEFWEVSSGFWVWLIYIDGYSCFFYWIDCIIIICNYVYFFLVILDWLYLISIWCK